VSNGYDLFPPGLELCVGLNSGGVGVVVVDVFGEPGFEGVPEGEAVVGVRVVFDGEFEAVRGGGILDGEAPVDEVLGESLEVKLPVLVVGD